MALDMRQFSVVENIGLTHLLSVLEPRYQLPSRPHFSLNVLPHLYSEVRAKLVEDLSNDKCIALTMDGWTSRVTQSFMTEKREERERRERERERERRKRREKRERERESESEREREREERARERERETCCVFAAQYVSLCHQKRRHSVCPELMFPAHVDYIMTYLPLYYLNVYFVFINLILYFI